MKVLRYTGTSHVREFSSVDIHKAWGINTSDVIIDTRVSRDVTVNNRLAAKLMESGEFEFRGDAEDTEEELTERAAAIEAAEEAERVATEERRQQEIEQAHAKAESGEGAVNTGEGSPITTEPSESAHDIEAAPSNRPRPPRPQQ